jgi:hypothetical protein
MPPAVGGHKNKIIEKEVFLTWDREKIIFIEASVGVTARNKRSSFLSAVSILGINMCAI